jgi:DNA-binding MarR family transcriptional regulator
MGIYGKAANVKIKIRPNRTVITNKKTRERRKYINKNKRAIIAAFASRFLPVNTVTLAEKLGYSRNYVEKVVKSLFVAGFLEDTDLFD